ncbi:MAG: hypothetical protein R3C14_28685 [Caldilineaceae bacterium]
MSNRYDLTENFVAPVTGEIVNDSGHEITTAEAQLMSSGHHLANVALSGRSGLSRAQQEDTAVTHAAAHLVASAPVVVALLASTTGIVLLGYLVMGGSFGVWFGVELVIVGLGALVALVRSRRAGLEHTPAGVERHEIDQRAAVAMHAIDRHCEMVERLKGVRQ